MRIAYYPSEAAREAGTFSIREVDNVYFLDEHRLVVDRSMFMLDGQTPYQDYTAEDLMEDLLRNGYLDLRPLSLWDDDKQKKV